MSILISNNKVTFNVWKFFEKLFKKVNDSEYLKMDFNKEIGSIMKVNKIDNHYIFSLISKTNPKDNLNKNLTYFIEINVINHQGELIGMPCRDSYNPDLKDQPYPNQLTPSYNIDFELCEYNRFDRDVLIKSQKFSYNAYNSIMVDQNQIMLYSKNQKFSIKNNPKIVLDYAKNSNLSIHDNMYYFNKFLEVNKDYFLTEEGQLDLQILLLTLTNTNKNSKFKGFKNFNKKKKNYILI